MVETGSACSAQHSSVGRDFDDRASGGSPVEARGLLRRRGRMPPAQCCCTLPVPVRAILRRPTCALFLDDAAAYWPFNSYTVLQGKLSHLGVNTVGVVNQPKSASKGTGFSLSDFLRKLNHGDDQLKPAGELEPSYSVGISPQRELSSKSQTRTKPQTQVSCALISVRSVRLKELHFTDWSGLVSQYDWRRLAGTHGGRAAHKAGDPGTGTQRG